jgi:hypothetical protein
MEEEEMEGVMETLFAIFYVDDAYITSRDPVFETNMFECAGNDLHARDHPPPTPDRLLPPDVHRTDAS